ncbi:MAG: hypothetical protein Q9168_006796 [Polycauliona sp. 1 TL-2023]
MAQTNVYYTTIWQEQPINSPQALIKQINHDSAAKRDAVCVIENVSSLYIEPLITNRIISPVFMRDHEEAHAGKTDFWTLHHPWRWTPESSIDVFASSRAAHVDGMFEYHGMSCNASNLTSSPNHVPRECFQESPWPIQSNTRISYYRSHDFLCGFKTKAARLKLIKDTDIFLVDAPLALKGSTRPAGCRDRTTLRVQYATNRGGLILPQLFSQQDYSLLSSFQSFFQHKWHFRALFQDIPGVLPEHALLYLLASSTWETNLRVLDSNIKRISFRDLRDPKDDTNDELHDCREDLESLKSSIAETLKWIPVHLGDFFKRLPVHQVDNNWSPTLQPVQALRATMDEAEKLQMFLMDTFQLLLSSISVRDSKLSMQQAQQQSWLTQLASLYLPLSVLTGIFGMNLQEINGSYVPFWWALVVLAILFVGTAGIYYVLKHWKRRQERREVNATLAGKV